MPTDELTAGDLEVWLRSSTARTGFAGLPSTSRFTTGKPASTIGENLGKPRPRKRPAESVPRCDRVDEKRPASEASQGAKLIGGVFLLAGRKPGFLPRGRTEADN